MAPTTLFVSNFPFTTTESELRTLFEAHTPVKSLRIITDRDTGRSRGFAFIEVPTAGDAETAIGALNETMLKGRRLVVSHARGRGGPPEKAPNAEVRTPSEPVRHRIIIEWLDGEGQYAAEVPDLGVTARAGSLQEVVREIEARSRARVATASSSD